MGTDGKGSGRGAGGRYIPASQVQAAREGGERVRVYDKGPRREGGYDAQALLEDGRDLGSAETRLSNAGALSNPQILALMEDVEAASEAISNNAPNDAIGRGMRNRARTLATAAGRWVKENRTRQIVNVASLMSLTRQAGVVSADAILLGSPPRGR